jgi:hypothetical protein
MPKVPAVRQLPIRILVVNTGRASGSAVLIRFRGVETIATAAHVLSRPDAGELRFFMRFASPPTSPSRADLPAMSESHVSNVGMANRWTSRSSTVMTIRIL